MDKKRDDVLVMEKLRRPPNCWTLQQIGDLFGISRQRVHQIIGNTGHVAAVSTPPVEAGGIQAGPPASDTITDGYQTWSNACPMCGRQSMAVVRIGKVQCTYCG